MYPDIKNLKCNKLFIYIYIYSYNIKILSRARYDQFLCPEKEKLLLSAEKIVLLQFRVWFKTILHFGIRSKFEYILLCDTTHIINSRLCQCARIRRVLTRYGFARVLRG